MYYKCHVWLFQWGLVHANSGPCACSAHTLPTGSSPQAPEEPFSPAYPCLRLSSPVVFFRALDSTSLAEVWIYKYPGIGTELASSQWGSHVETGMRTRTLMSGSFQVLTKLPIITTWVPFLPSSTQGWGQGALKSSSSGIEPSADSAVALVKGLGHPWNS